MLPPKLLSKVDNKDDGEMRHLKFSRGPGSGITFRIKTPSAPIGMTCPWTQKPFGAEITRGTGTRRLRTRLVPLRAKIQQRMRIAVFSADCVQTKAL